MKAIVQDTYGSTEALELREIDKPAIGDDEVLVRVRAAGLDRGVWHMMTGQPYLMRVMGCGFRGPKVRVPGMDVAGRVEALGKDVTRFREGDQVFGVAAGSFAEYACAQEERLALVPANLDAERAAAIPVSACTALHGLREKGQVRAGQRVLVVGASGGVGTFAVQLAKALGAEVTGVCSTAKAELVRSIGADHVVDYTREDFTEAPERYDLILDIGGNRSLSRLRRALVPRGTLVLVGGEHGGRWTGGMHRQLGALLLSPFVRHDLRAFIATVSREKLLFLKELVEAGRVAPVIDRTYRLDQVPEAIRRLEQGHVQGKVVITL